MGVVLIAGLYLLLPFALERVVANRLQDQFGLSSEPNVDLWGGPIGMLFGEFDGAEILLPPGDFFGEVRPEEIAVELAPFDVDVPASVAQRRISTEGPVPGTLRVTLSEEEVSRLAQQGAYGAFPVLGVDLERDAATVRSEAAVLGQAVPVSVEGGVGVQSGTIVFEPQRVEASGAEVPQSLVGSLLQGTGFSYPIGGLPPGATVTGAEAEKDRLVLMGEVGDLALLAGG